MILPRILHFLLFCQKAALKALRLFFTPMVAAAAALR